MSGVQDVPELTPEVLLRAYSLGIFPMAESATDPTLHWIEPRQRGILPLETFHVPKKLARLVRSDRFSVQVDGDFAAVIAACAAPAEGRETTWINRRISELYTALHERGRAHSVEVYESGRLVGGLYGVSIGAAFFGESMFHRATDASKVALVHLVGRLVAGGYRLLDAQFITSHLAQFGAVEVSRNAYRRLLDRATSERAEFYRLPRQVPGAEIMATIASAKR